LSFGFISLSTGITEWRILLRVYISRLFVESSTNGIPRSRTKAMTSSLETWSMGRIIIMPCSIVSAMPGGTQLCRLDMSLLPALRTIFLFGGMPDSPFAPAPLARLIIIVSTLSSAVWAVATLLARSSSAIS
jgi:hypothetical protein